MSKNHKHDDARRHTLRRLLAGAGVASFVAGVAAVPAYATDDCAPSPGYPESLTAWSPASHTGWQATDTSPADPDGQSGEDNHANLIQIGEVEQRRIDDGPLRVTGWQADSTPPAVDEGEEIGDRYERTTGDAPWTETIIVTDEEGWTETIPAETHVVHHDAETRTVHHPAETTFVQHPAETLTVHHEGTPAETHTEYRYRTRVHRPGNTVERKFVKGYDFVDGGTVKVNGVTVSGHWVSSPGWHQIPDSVINAYWGSGGINKNLLGGTEQDPKGDVPLSVYGGPSVSVPYYASEVSISGGYTDWGPWSGWSRDNAGGDTDTRDTESREVTDREGTDPWEETVIVKDAWTETVIDTPERTVEHPAVTHEETIEHPGNQITEYAWDVNGFHHEYRWSLYTRTVIPAVDPVVCEDPEQPPVDPEKPVNAGSSSPVGQLGGAPTTPVDTETATGADTDETDAEATEYKELAHTGAAANTLLPGAALGLIGGALLAARRRQD